jgi:hypothetical protein
MTIRLIQLPSASAIGSFTAKDAVRSHKFNFGIADLTMDPTQDLVVVSEPQCVALNSYSDRNTVADGQISWSECG